MLSVKNVTKIYGRGKLAVKALDGVSINFPQTGMVMILGKSGCGKSTLMNILGGLDRPTSGDVYINGTPFADLSAQKLDDYRNTYIGFVFQNFNIIENRSVYENIEIALKLQNHRSDFESIDDILNAVGLYGLGYRKPSELSGGQRQRVAIARALVKEPEVILADEPSGSLDSATGDDLFASLKKISKTKLIIVVTHDKEIAYKYGDRIIFMQDGRITGDIDRIKKPEDADTKKIRDNIMFVKAGCKVENSDISSILDNGKDNYLTFLTDKQHVALAYPDTIDDIDEGYSPGDFELHDEPEPTPPPPLKLRRAEMSFKNCLSQAGANVKKRKGRFIVMVIVSLLCLCLLSTGISLSSANAEKIIRNTVSRGGLDLIFVSTGYRYGEDAYNGIYDSFREFAPGLAYSENVSYLTVNDIKLDEDPMDLLTGFQNDLTLSGIVEFDDFSALSAHLKYGSAPSSANEAVISDITADTLVSCGLITKDENGNYCKFTPVSADQLVGKTMLVGSEAYHREIIISGILGTSAKRLSSSDDKSITALFTSNNIPGHYKKLFVKRGFTKELSEYFSYETEGSAVVFAGENMYNYLDDIYCDMIYSGTPSLSVDGGTYTLEKGEIAVTLDIAERLLDAFKAYEYEGTVPDADSIYLAVYNNYMNLDEPQKFKIKAIASGTNTIVFSREDMNVREEVKYATSLYLFTPESDTKKVLKAAEENNCDISSPLFYSLLNTVKTMHGVSRVLLIASAAFAVFLFIIILNFLSLLIKERNKEMGIMRALGTSGPVTLKVFYIELGFLDIIITTGAVIMTAKLISDINSMVGLILSGGVSWVSYGIVEILLTFLIFTAFLAVTAFPMLHRIAKRQPIDVIRSI